MTQRTWWLCYWLAWILWALIAVVVLISGDAMAYCSTPLTCLYGNETGREMEYREQQRRMEGMERRQREMEMEQRERDTQRELDRLRDQVDRWRGSPSPSEAHW